MACNVRNVRATPCALNARTAGTFSDRAKALDAVLADGLPDDYAVYHAVHWTGMDGQTTKVFEINAW